MGTMTFINLAVYKTFCFSIEKEKRVSKIFQLYFMHAWNAMEATKKCAYILTVKNLSLSYFGKGQNYSETYVTEIMQVIILRQRGNFEETKFDSVK